MKKIRVLVVDDSVVIRRLYEVRTEKIFWELLPHEVRLQGAASDADAEIAATGARAGDELRAEIRAGMAAG